MARPSGDRIAAGGAEEPDGFTDPEGQRVGNDGVADRYFSEMRQRRNQRRQIVAGEVMAGIETEPGGFGGVASRHDLVELMLLGGGLEGAAIRPRIDLDPVGADL